MPNNDKMTYDEFKKLCFDLGQENDLDVWDSDVDELWDIDAQEESHEEILARLREIHFR